MSLEDAQEVRRAILGDNWIEHSSQAGPTLTEFAGLATEHVWGAYWNRPGLERRLRSAVTIAVLTSLEAEEELVAHVRGALRNQFFTATEIREIVLHLTPYLGFPRVRHALSAFADILDEAD